MDQTRAKILISNLLCEIVEHVWEQGGDQYDAWLLQEVGFTQDEIDELKKEGLFHSPSDYERD